MVELRSDEASQSGPVRPATATSAVGVIRVLLTVLRSLPVFPWKQTSSRPVGMSQRCQSTKSLRSSPLRGSKSREAGSRSREASDSGVASINSRIVGVQRMIKNNRIISNQATL